MAKSGAEGVYMAGLAGRGLGLAVKARDGHERGAIVTLIALLEFLGALDEAARAALRDFQSPLLRNVRGLEVGGLQATTWGAWSSF